MKNDKDYIFNKISKRISCLYDDYKFLEISKDSLNTYAYEIIEKNISSFNDCPSFYENILVQIKMSLDNAIKNRVENNLIKVCDSFVKNNFIPVKSYNSAINNFNKFKKVFFSNDSDMDPSRFYEFLISNCVFDSNIEYIVNKNINNIKNGNLSIFLDDDILCSFIEMYCSKHNIEFGLFDVDDIINDSSSSDLKLYKNQMGRYPLLNIDEEYELFNRYKNGDLDAKEKLINSNLRLVFRVAANYKDCGIPFSDLIQEGNIGLITAVERFDLNRKCKFSTYAFWWIRQAVKRYIDNSSSVIRVPVYFREKYSEFLKVLKTLTIELGRNPTELEVAKKMGIPMEKVLKLIGFNLYCTSLNENVGDEEDSELGDFIADESFDILEMVSDKILNKDIFDLFKKVGLNDKEIYTLSFRYGLIDNQVKTLEWIGKKLGLTRERVRQLEMRALGKLRRNPDTKKFANYMDDPEAAIKFIGDCNKKFYSKEKYKRQMQNSDFSNNQSEKNENEVKNRSNGGEKYMGGKKTLYATIPYERNLVEEALKYLTEEEISYLKIRFGEDYEHPCTGDFDHNFYYNCVKPRIIKVINKLKKGEEVVLAPPRRKIKKTNVNKMLDNVETKNDVKEEVLVLEETKNNEAVVNIQHNNVVVEDKVHITANVDGNLLFEENSKFNLDLSDIVKNIDLNNLSIVQKTVITLKLGQINGKFFTNEEISNFLEIPVEEIIRITKNVLETYKSYVMNLIDKEFDKIIYDVSNVRVRNDENK